MTKDTPRGMLVPGGGRDLEQLKQEVQRRADRNLPPLGGIAPEDARVALARVTSLDREQWATAFGAVAETHWQHAESLAGKDRSAAAREYWQAWRLHHFARWPTENTPAKRHARQRALESFRQYAALADPPIEVVHIPFEGQQITAYLRLPAGVQPGAACIRHRRPRFAQGRRCRPHRRLSEEQPGPVRD